MSDANHEVSLSLLENGLDFIVKGLEELYGKGQSLKSAEPTEVDARNYKYGVTNLFAGFLLLLKERLSQHLLELIFTGKLADVRQKLKTGRRIPTTVDLEEALERLETGPRVSFSCDELEVIHRIQDFRNQFEHYKVKVNKYQLWAELAKFLDVVERFLQQELGINLNEHSRASQVLHRKAQGLREEVMEFDSALEKRAYETLRHLSGRQVPGELLNTDHPVVLPRILSRRQTYEIQSGRKYISDFEGESEEGKWIIEIKGAYLPRGPSSALDQLGAARSSLELTGTKAWLIVFGDVTPGVKEQARKSEIYLTDLEAWQEIEHLEE